MAGMLGYWYRLYHNLTPSEQALEPAIAALGERYRCQHPFLRHKHFADFALLDRKRIIEVDGDSHELPRQKEKDLLHMIALAKEGWDVIRVSNDEANLDPVGAVARALNEFAPSLSELQERLQRLHRDYPELLEKRVRGQRRGAVPRKRPASESKGRGSSKRRKAADSSTES